jgi:hypothetical protein
LAAVSNQASNIAADYATDTALTSAISTLQTASEAATASLETSATSSIATVTQSIQQVNNSLLDYATLDNLRGLNVNTLLETTSGDCNMTNLRVVRYNTITRQHQV